MVSNFFLKLVDASSGEDWQTYKKIRADHYVKDHGMIGKQCKYLILVDGKPIGIIAGASACYSCKPRDEFFNISKVKEVKGKQIQEIIQSNVFRLLLNEANLASRILSIWSIVCARDWKKKYGGNVVGYESFIDGKDKRNKQKRNGACYKAAGWSYIGKTKGAVPLYKKYVKIKGKTAYHTAEWSQVSIEGWRKRRKSKDPKTGWFKDRHAQFMVYNSYRSTTKKLIFCKRV